MAKEAKPEAEIAVVVPRKKSKKLLIIIAATLVLILVIGGGVIVLLMKSHNAKSGEDGELVSETAAVAKKKIDKEAAPVYVALDAFTVNLIGDQFLQLVMSVEVTDMQTGDRIK